MATTMPQTAKAQTKPGTAPISDTLQALIKKLIEKLRPAFQRFVVQLKRHGAVTAIGLTELVIAAFWPAGAAELLRIVVTALAALFIKALLSTEAVAA